MIYYNKNQIVSIECIDEMEHPEYEYIENEGVFGLFKLESGFYFKGSTNKLLVIPNNCYTKEKKIYLKAHFIITFSNQDILIKYFNTIKERNLYLKRNFPISTTEYYLEK